MHDSARTSFLLRLLLAGLWMTVAVVSDTIDAEELSRSAVHSTTNKLVYPAAFDQLFLPDPKFPEGVVSSPALSPAEKAAMFVAGLSEEARYRTLSGIESLFAQDLNPSVVIDNDWKKVTNTRNDPFRAVCQLDCWFQPRSGPLKNLEGTGFMVGPRIIVTNAHNLYKNDVGGWVKSVSVHPGRDGNIKSFGSADGVSFSVPGEWLGREIADYDIGWIVLPDYYLWDRVGYGFGYTTTSDKTLKGLTLQCAGFPDSSTYHYRMYHDQETADPIPSKNSFKHFLDTSSGSSGSPVYYKTANNDYIAVGVHRGWGSGPKHNVATRMTRTYYDWTQDFVRQNR